MSAKKLIEVALDKGYAIGRNKSGEYSYWFADGSSVKICSFAGTWQQFVQFVKMLPSRK